MNQRNTIFFHDNYILNEDKKNLWKPII